MSEEVDVITLGNIVLEDFEVLESISFGRVREIAVNKVAGGIVVIQDFGDFPPERIMVRGTLYGAGCEDRSNQIEQLCKIGKPVPLTWRQWKYTGVVKTYIPSPRHFTDIPYELEFVPLENQSTGASQEDPVTAPRVIDYSVSQVAKSINNPPAGITFSDDLKKAVQDLQNLARNGKNAGFSNLSDNQKQKLADAAAEITRQLQEVKNGSDSLASSTAGDLINYMKIIEQQATTNAPFILEVPVSNPNLPQLAAQYYGDHSKWELIAKANNLGIDTNPQGEYILKIPYSPSQLDQKAAKG